LVSNSPLDIDPTTSCQAIQAWPAGGMAEATDTAQSDISAPTKKPTCQKCNQENEISSHLILDCEALGQTQHKIFSQYLLLPSLYNSEQLKKMIQKATITCPEIYPTDI
jgi:hypothetical protein